MAAGLEETQVTYEELADLEREFEDVETEIIRQQVELTRPLYVKRAGVVSQIPNFWPLVIEQAPPDIDEYIQPSDSALLLASLASLEVAHFEIEDGGQGDPRSVSIKFEFGANDHFEDLVLEKKFWHRHAKDGWSGLVSDPVEIRWKKGKDLTGGLLGLVKKVWDEEQAAPKKRGKGKGGVVLSAAQQALKKHIDNTGLGGLSFFAWFGYRGRHISAEESRRAVAMDQERKRRREEGNEPDPDAPEDEDDDDYDDYDDDDLEIFPDGDDLAICISEDLWPGAIKYFTQAQEQDAASDDDFESDDEGGEGDEGGDDRPSKKRRA